MSHDAGQLAVEEAANISARLDRDTTTYLDRVRRAVARRAVSASPPDEVQAALVVVEGSAYIDVDVPTTSRRRALVLVKVTVKRLTGWYLGYVGRQVSLFGQAVARLGSVLVERTQRLEQNMTAIGEKVDRLEARVERLENETGDR
jgi:hypothetical protein